MKRIALVFCVAFAFAGIGPAAYRTAATPTPQLSKYVPAGPVLYLEAKDLSSLLGDWSSSPQKREWIQSDSYEVFSRSRLFLRLQGAGDQFAAAAGLPPDMNFVSQVSGGHSVLALYDIGNLQFVYITYLPSAKSVETKLWQTRAKFESRSAGGINFYLRRDPDSKREVAFAISGDYLLLATREDLMAGCLQLMSGQPGRSVETEKWWAQSVGAAGETGDLRMALDLEKLVPNGYFRTYWVQQNITDLSQYSAAVSDLFRSSNEYREERLLIRNEEPEQTAPAAGLAAVAKLARLVPVDAGIYIAKANPTPDSCFDLLEAKLLEPQLGPGATSQSAPQVQLTSGAQGGGGSDLETRIDQVPPEHPSTQSASALQALLHQTPVLASLQIQSTEHDKAGVFVRLHSAVILMGDSEWDEVRVRSALAEFIRPDLTASQLGVAWQQKAGYQELDGLWPLAVAVRGNSLLVSNEPEMLKSILANFTRTPDRKPAELLAGFNHEHERNNFRRLAGVVDRSNTASPGATGASHQPQFFSGNLASLSATLAAVSAETIEVRGDGGTVRQTVTYAWLH